MGRAYGMFDVWEERKRKQGFCGASCRKETIWKTEMWVGEIIKMGFKEMGWEGMDWLNVSQNMDHCQAVVNTVMNLHIP